ncbi:hypothetical protein DH2020_035629 [Rehmannia glutinosa]|uniref:Eukaryotic translation initiation factor 5B n=1 Tax=Rehmannia glutinosa TaxID=99300 RepID=A0ABR0V8U3_REHGL
MGRKKPTAGDEKSGAAGGGAGGESKKGAFVISNDSHSIGAELSEDVVVTEEKAAPVGNKKKGKKETNTNLPGKKVPKHVKEIQEKLAKIREAEEKKKREEEERLRKEEEEWRRKEQEEREAEEKKRLKKEKEKEKLMKKKQEGKLLTGKQKEEARRLEAMRKQILANSSLQLPTGEPAGAPGKRPLYQKKKPKPQATLESVEGRDSKENQQEFVSELDSVEAENTEDLASSITKDVVQEVGVDEEEEEQGDDDDDDDDDDEEWDAKSWDEADLKLPGKSAFSDEEVDTEPEPLLKKEIKNARIATQDVELPSATTKTVGLTEKVASVMPRRSETEDADRINNKIPPDKKNKKEVLVTEDHQRSDDHPAQNGQNLRSPICCIMGHVDTGKTKLLDCIRGTNVQEGEAGGITQQIGATYFPAENIRERTMELKADAKLNVPGLLVIDTPGHESFTNLRSRGSGLCDIAILVVDIMHGLEPQTIESLNLLKMRNTDFIVALNKVDRLNGWKTCRNAPIRKAMNQQTKNVQDQFNGKLNQIRGQFMEQGLNTELYYKNKSMGETFSIVPTSAIRTLNFVASSHMLVIVANSGEGIPDLLLLLVQWAQRTMVKRLTYSNEVQCTVLEVKVVEGHGTTIDVVLVNGVLREGDQVVVCGLQGTYLHHKEIKAAQGIKITAQGLEHTIAGTSLYVVGPRDDLENIKEAAMEDMKSVMTRIDKSGEGVYVQASTLGYIQVAVMVVVPQLFLDVGTPLCVPQRDFIEIGRIASIENNHKPVDYAKKGQKVAIKIIGSNPEEKQKMFGRHFEIEDELVSRISRNSLDALKENFAEDLSVEEKRLLFKLKKLFKIP